MFDRLDDTIAAISSPPGVGTRGILRLSGPQAFELAGSMVSLSDGGSIIELAGHQRRPGRLWLDEQASVPVEVYAFRAPASYTRQDLVELHTVGSPPVLALVLERLAEGGARVALPGEFTGRAFLGGAMDLTGVEGVAALIHAQTDAQLRASEALLHGALSRRTRAMREELADLLARLEAEIDFADEPVEFVAPSEVLEVVNRIGGELQEMLNRGSSAERLEVLPRVVLVGLPNAGKSALFNRLTGIDRAIQSAVAGTTRDVITAPLDLPGGEAILCDTAGIQAERANRDHMPGDMLTVAIESATQRAIRMADLVLVVVDASDAPDQAVSLMASRLHDRRSQIVYNKVDILDRPQTPVTTQASTAVSAKTGQGIDKLLERMSQILFEHAEKQGAELICLSERHRRELNEGHAALMRASELIGKDLHVATAHAELLALELRHAIHALSLLLGDVTTEDLLGRIFSRFCIGK